jgi:RHS repeat-associated protein
MTPRPTSRRARNFVVAALLPLLVSALPIAVRGLGAQSGPGVAVASANPGATVARHLCLTIAAGSSAAYQCGDLTVSHPLPAVQTLGTSRAPTLLYNSQHASPYPIVAANVTIGASVPDTVIATLKIGGITRATGRWHGSSWTPGSTRRVVVGFSAASATTWPTGVYGYTLEVYTKSGGTSSSTTIVSGDLSIVNRSASPFGAGWWVAGLEELHFPADTTQRIWVGGDGSVRRYTKVASGVWAASAVDRPDTLKWNGTTSRYVRELPQGLKVQFTSDGRHEKTINRLDHTTTFTYSSGRLYRIIVPTNTATAPYFQFNYTNSKLSSVSSPGQGSARTTTVWNSGVVVDSIRDPDNRKVKFTYTTNRMTHRADRRGTVTRYTYAASAGAFRLTQVRVDNGGMNLTSSLTPAETRSLSTGTAITAWHPDSTYTLLDGPRTDVTDHTRFYVVHRFGAPWKIRDALGNQTTITRANATYPALVTTVTHPGYTENTAYNARGNVESETAVNPHGSGNAVTSYKWGSGLVLRDFPTKVTRPEGDYDTLAYHANGNVQWRRDSRGVASEVKYRYDTGTNLVRAVQYPDNGVDSLTYDALGNVIAHRTPLLFTTTYHRDSVGRDTLVIAPPVGSNTLRTRNTYDLMNRVTLSRSETNSVTYSCFHCKSTDNQSVPAQVLHVSSTYDAEGNLASVYRTVDPASAGVDLQPTLYTYDRANRKTTETNHDRTTTYTYDPAGNLKTVTTPAGKTTTSTYDAANRLTRRIVPEVFYSKYVCPSEFSQDVPCLQGLDFDSLRIRPDTQTFAHDAAGRMTAAHNRYARVKRTYFPGGTLQTDSLRLRKYGKPYLPDGTSGGGGGGAPGCPPDCIEDPWFIEPDDGLVGIMSATALPGDPYPDSEFTNHIYGLRYTYDRNGRRTSLEHPNALTPGTPKTVTYTYHAWGPPQSITGLMGDSYSFTYDSNGRHKSTTYPGSVTESYTYDRDNRRTARHLVRGTLTLIHDTLTYDARGKTTTVSTTPGIDETFYAYSGLGATVARSWSSSQGYQVDEYRADPHGNQYWAYQWDHIGGEAPRYSYQYNVSGQLLRKVMIDFWPGTSVFRSYDADGNVDRGSEVPHSMSGGYGRRPVRYYYAADGKLRAIKRYIREDRSENGLVDHFDDLITEVRYDALGRRVIQHTRHYPECKDSQTCNHAIERYIWDGDQVLYELRANGSKSANLETQWGSGIYYGRVGYVHGPGIDAPLGVMRMDHSLGSFFMAPHANARGQYLRGTKLNGSDCGLSGCGTIDWPAPKVRMFLDGVHRPLYDWMGSLIQDHRDQSGLLYRRNRYYDPNSGQFTQMDPIGIAGGLNVYGFANGDPINFSDPFGLCPSCGEEALEYWAQMSANSTGLVRAGATAAGLFAALWTPDTWKQTTVTLVAGGAASAGVRALASRGAASQPSPGMLRQFERQAAEHGRGSVERSVRTFERRLDEHVRKADEIRRRGGNPGSVEREISNFQRQIDAAKRVLENLQ